MWFDRKHEHRWGEWDEQTHNIKYERISSAYAGRDTVTWEEPTVYMQRRCIDCKLIDRLKITTRTS